jgi:antitoxin PrlF
MSTVTQPFSQVEDDADRIMDATKATITITVKGQVTLPKRIREAVGLKPGDKVDVRATASGGVYIEKPGASRSYRERLYALTKERSIKVGLNPGHKVEVRATASGGVYIEKPGTSRSYRERLYAFVKERPIRDITTDEFMKMMRGDPAEDPPLKE